MAFHGVSKKDYDDGYKDGEYFYREEVLRAIKKAAMKYKHEGEEKIPVHVLIDIVRNVRGRYV